ncbi:MAG TPA: LpqB family beta-propeller domain-containing protein, partial [Phytomonospora sp.]
AFVDQSDSAVRYLVKGAVTPGAPGAYQSIKDGKYVANSMTRQHTAVVHGSNRLTVYVTSSTKFADAVVTSFKVGGLPAGTLGRPTWVGEQTMLLPIGDRLYAINARSDGNWKVQAGGLVDGVGRVSAAPDGGRLALTVNGRAYVVPVIPQGDGTVELGDRRAVDPGHDNVIDVGWSEEHRLILLNSGPRDFLRKVTIDNLQSAQLNDEGPSFPPDYLTVLCDSPADGRSESAKVYVVVKGTLYQAESTGLRELEDAEQLPLRASAPFF